MRSIGTSYWDGGVVSLAQMLAILRTAILLITCKDVKTNILCMALFRPAYSYDAYIFPVKIRSDHVAILHVSLAVVMQSCHLLCKVDMNSLFQVGIQRGHSFRFTEVGIQRRHSLFKVGIQRRHSLFKVGIQRRIPCSK